MNRILFAIAGFTMVLALVVAAPGTAGAIPLATSLSLGGSAVVTGYGGYNFGDSLTMSEGADKVITLDVGPETLVTRLPAWTLTDSSAGLQPSVTVTGATFSISGNQVALAGNWTIPNVSTAIIGGVTTETWGYTAGTPFSVTGTLSGFTNDKGYTWNVVFPNLTPLGAAGNGAFLVAGEPFSGSIGFSTSGNGATFVALSSQLAAVPIPPALVLLAPALLGLAGIRKRFKG